MGAVASPNGMFETPLDLEMAQLALAMAPRAKMAQLALAMAPKAKAPRDGSLRSRSHRPNVFAAHLRSVARIWRRKA